MRHARPLATVVINNASFGLLRGKDFVSSAASVNLVVPVPPLGQDVALAPIPAEVGLRLPDKPSIAVLPFANVSGESDQEYFSDGITEDIITALSRLRWFFVIARSSTLGYKGQGVDVRQVGRNLGVRYVLEGSVRKSGQRLRISSQLLDATGQSRLVGAIRS